MEASFLGKIIIVIALLNGANATQRAVEIAEDFKLFFGEGISNYVENFPRRMKTVSLWHVAISKLDIPDHGDCTKDSTALLHQLLSSIVKEISSVPYPDRLNKNNPNHDWWGRAGYSFRGLINRFNHDTLNMMRQASSSLHFAYMLRRDRPELWNRILKGRNIYPISSNECNSSSCAVSNDEEKLYLQNIFVAASMASILRFDEGTVKYEIANSKREFLKQEWTANGVEALPGFQIDDFPGKICSGWLLQRIGTSSYYKPLLGEYVGHMVNALTIRNIVKNQTQYYQRIFYDKNGIKIDDLDSISDEVFATHAESGFVNFGHYVDHIRLDYSHVTVPVGSGTTIFFDLFERLFGEKDEMTERVKEVYSFWTYLTKQAGILNRMRQPEDIKVEEGKTFATSNPWSRVAMAGVNGSKWAELGTYFEEKDITPVDKRSPDQKAFQDKVQNFDNMFNAFFSLENLEADFKGRQKGLVDFIVGVFSETNTGVCELERDRQYGGINYDHSNYSDVFGDDTCS